ncbi:hypothetical protein DENSPDRAFT_880661 [Dentipellis sp. KUC8613]|nr:hypothetical protein DENSPDRAFT_880661 [Dentipellis sp. KUC8613]
MWMEIDDNDTPLDVGLELSAEGGETEYFADYLGNGTTSRLASQAWTTRIRNAEEKWVQQLPALIDAYLVYQSDGFCEDQASIDTFPLFSVDIFGA